MRHNFLWDMSVTICRPLYSYHKKAKEEVNPMAQFGNEYLKANYIVKEEAKPVIKAFEINQS